MPTTRKQKSKVRNRKRREADKLSDLKYMDMMLGTNHFERKKSELRNSARRPECPSYNALVNKETTSHSNSRKKEIRILPATALTQEELNLVANPIGYRSN